MPPPRVMSRALLESGPGGGLDRVGQILRLLSLEIPLYR